MRPEAPGVRAKHLLPNFAIIGNCRLGDGHGDEVLMEGNELRMEQHNTSLLL